MYTSRNHQLAIAKGLQRIERKDNYNWGSLSGFCNKNPESGMKYQGGLNKAYFRMMLEIMCRQLSSIWLQKHEACVTSDPNLNPIFELGLSSSCLSCSTIRIQSLVWKILDDGIQLRHRSLNKGERWVVRQRVRVKLLQHIGIGLTHPKGISYLSILYRTFQVLVHSLQQ